MRPELEKYQAAEAFLSNEMSKTQRADFEAQMAHDQDLSQFVAEQSELNQIITGAELWSLQSQMSADLANWKAPADNKAAKIWAGAALLAAAVGVGVTIAVWPSEDAPKAIETVEIQTTNVEEPAPQLNFMDSTKQPIQSYNSIAKTVVTPTTESNLHKDPIAEATNEVVVIEFPTVEEVSKNEPENITIVECEINITTPATVYPSCDKYATGEIDLTTLEISGISDLAVVTLLNSDGETVNSYDHLAAANYFISIDDGDECATMETLKIPSESCTTDFIFSPSKEYTWTPSLDLIGPGSMQIVSTMGVVVFAQEFNTISEVQWNGIDNYGSALAPDIYAFVIQTNSSNIKGSVTITPKR